MAHYRAKVTLPYRDGLPSNVAVNNYSVEADVGELFGVGTAIANVYNAVQASGGRLDTYLGPVLSRGTNVPTVKFYDRALPDDSPPVEIVPFTLGPSTPGSINLPEEVALCGSFQGVTGLAGVVQARRRGRIYYGPFNATAITEEAVTLGCRPAAALVTVIAEAHENLLGVVTALGATWEVWSQVAGSATAITNGWVDNAFDTMRSRGTKASGRLTWSQLELAQLVSIRSRRVVGPIVCSATGTLLYTVPAERTLIIKTATLYNSTAAAQAAGLRAPGNGATQAVLTDTIAPTSVSVRSPYLILNPGDSIYGVATVSGTIYVALFGSLLLGAPS